MSYWLDNINMVWIKDFDIESLNYLNYDVLLKFKYLILPFMKLIHYMNAVGILKSDFIVKHMPSHVLVKLDSCIYCMYTHIYSLYGRFMFYINGFNYLDALHIVDKVQVMLFLGLAIEGLTHQWCHIAQRISSTLVQPIPDNKDHGANMGPTWVLSAPDGPHVGPMNLAIRDGLLPNGNVTALSSLGYSGIDWRTI